MVKISVAKARVINPRLRHGATDGVLSEQSYGRYRGGETILLLEGYGSLRGEVSAILDDALKEIDIGRAATGLDVKTGGAFRKCGGTDDLEPAHCCLWAIGPQRSELGRVLLHLTVRVWCVCGS